MTNTGDTLYLIRKDFIEKVTQDGVGVVFIGLENINPDNLLTLKSTRNKITELSRDAAAMAATAAHYLRRYILGFPGGHQGVDPARCRGSSSANCRSNLLEFFF